MGIHVDGIRMGQVVTVEKEKQLIIGSSLSRLPTRINEKSCDGGLGGKIPQLVFHVGQLAAIV